MKEENTKSPIQLKEVIEGNNPDVYVIQGNIGGCAMCGRKEDLRIGWCFDCAEAQNILAVGKGMYEDDDEKDIKFPIKEVNKRLKMLLEKGWIKSNKI